MPIGSEVSTLLIDIKKSNALTDIASPRTGVKSSGKLWCNWSWRHFIDKISRCQCIQELMRERKDMIMRCLHDEERDKAVSYKTELYGLVLLVRSHDQSSDGRRFPGIFPAHLDHQQFFSMVSADFANRPLKSLCLFDVDGTLTLARKVRLHP